jgi:hypothetical protein
MDTEARRRHPHAGNAMAGTIIGVPYASQSHSSPTSDVANPLAHRRPPFSRHRLTRSTRLAGAAVPGLQNKVIPPGVVGRTEGRGGGGAAMAGSTAPVTCTTRALPVAGWKLTRRASAPPRSRAMTGNSSAAR